MRYFYIEPTALKKPNIALEGSEVRHIKNVLRLKPGDTIRLFDGQGFEYEAAIQHMRSSRVELRITHKYPAAKESPLQMVIAQSLLKEKKMDGLLRHLCELGITHWVPFISERSVAKPGANRLPGRTARWEKILKESCKQCQRARLPEIVKMMSFDEVLYFGQSFDLKIVFYENESATLDSLIQPAAQPALQKILLILGPEGGFSNQEIEKAKAAGFAVAGLGPRILRAETAAIAACTLIQYLFGDMR